LILSANIGKWSLLQKHPQKLEYLNLADLQLSLFTLIWKLYKERPSEISVHMRIQIQATQMMQASAVVARDTIAQRLQQTPLGARSSRRLEKHKRKGSDNTAS